MEVKKAGAARNETATKQADTFPRAKQLHLGLTTHLPG
eukprot:CAMPEP_0172764412 /NCGR_PEP_ID=MMETSP1074-20121228/177197_1 /TAXON_ID=2916 /ORGANISM="Ceratium fusus, Strain PA161109" /LENGTH=37 /DNA_ID= /DNA_START= /DNA_END= /DNA_ORIENTATION=